MKIEFKNIEETNKLIIKRGYSQRGLGRAVDISVGYMNQLLNGERNPGPKTAKKIVDELEIEFDKIFLPNMITKVNKKVFCQADNIIRAYCNIPLRKTIQ